MTSEKMQIDKTISELKVLILGETIIDEYVFVNPTGRASKDPILSTQFISSEKYLGGVLATARHLINFVKEVHVISLVGDEDNEVEWIKKTLPENISTTFFVKKNSPTIKKRRYIEPSHYRKLFKTEFLNNRPIEKEMSEEIIDHIDKNIEKYDLILVNDFGHGFIDGNIANYISAIKKFVALNVQTNSSNYGYNPPTKYKYADYLSLNIGELRLLYRTKDEDYETLLNLLGKKNRFEKVLLTLGKRGCAFYKEEQIKSLDALSVTPIDTIGAGDAVFAITSLYIYLDYKTDDILKLANAVGAAAVNIIGNKESITRELINRYM